MINRQAYIDDYGLVVDPLFDMVDKLEAQVAELTAEAHMQKQCAEKNYQSAMKFQAQVAMLTKDGYAWMAHAIQLKAELAELREAIGALVKADCGIGDTYEAWTKVKALLEAENKSLIRQLSAAHVSESELEAENAKLKEALTAVAYWGLDNVSETVRDIAKAALEVENEHMKACAELANDISDYNNR